MIGFHFQKPINGWVNAYKKLPHGTPVKFIDNVQALAEIKAERPDLFTVLRHWYDHDQVFGGDIEHRKQVARDFYATFIDGTFDNYAHAVDAIEDWNEYIANSHNADEKQDRINHAWAMAYVWWHEYRVQEKYKHIRLILCNTAIGNDIPVEYAQIAQDFDCILGYHSYIHFDTPNHIDTVDWIYHSGRWTEMDYRYRQAGYPHTRWIFTEGGPYTGVLEGWRHDRVCGGNIDDYMTAMQYWLNQTSQWNKENNNRAIGVTLYNSGDATGTWKYYENDAEIINRVAGLDYEPTPPPEPPPNDDGLPRVQYERVYLCVPQDTTLDDWLSICEAAYKDKNTVGFSYDDAGIGKLDDKTAVLYGIEDQELFTNWFNKYYPSTRLLFRDLKKNSGLTHGPQTIE